MFNYFEIAVVNEFEGNTFVFFVFVFFKTPRS